MKLGRAISTALKKRVLLPMVKKLLSFAPIDNRGSGWRVLESFAGAWQQDIRVDIGAVDAYWANFACLTLICSDISKMPANVMQYDGVNKIWSKTAKRPVLKKPNHYQTTIEFLFSWVMSELRTGNTYVLKVRDSQTQYITGLYVLDPNRVIPYITNDGGVYYQLEIDPLSLLSEKTILVPASEIIHDRMYPMYHPLCGLPPVFACGVIAMQGHAIINTSTMFFGNRGMPAGILTAPGHIPDDTAQRLKNYFDANFTGQNAGKVAVLGDNLKFESMGGKASDAQLIEQLKMTGEIVCACYHVPGYKIGVGAIPTVSNTSVLNQQYYDQCLQYIIEKLEARLDDGLELDDNHQVWLDISALLRMDPQTKSTVLGQRIKDSIISTNEARREDDLPPVPGGEVPMIQQQNYSLEALARRDERDAPKHVPDGQIATIKDLLTAAADGSLPLDTVRAMIAAAYPSLTEEQIDAIMTPLVDFEPPAPPVAPVAPAATSEPPAAPAVEPAADGEPKAFPIDQMSSIQALITAAFEKKLPIASAKAIMVTTLKMSDEMAELIIGPLTQVPVAQEGDELELSDEELEYAKLEIPVSIGEFA